MDSLFSPGISGDNPNFGLAMWNGQDNNQAMDTGFYPGIGRTILRDPTQPLMTVQ